MWVVLSLFVTQEWSSNHTFWGFTRKFCSGTFATFKVLLLPSLIVTSIFFSYPCWKAIACFECLHLTRALVSDDFCSLRELLPLGNWYCLCLLTRCHYSKSRTPSHLNLIVHLILGHCTVLWKDYQHKSAQSAVALCGGNWPLHEHHCKGACFLFTAAGFSLIFELFPHTALTIIATDAAAPLLECKCSFSWHEVHASVELIRRFHHTLKAGITLHKVCHI